MVTLSEDEVARKKALSKQAARAKLREGFLRAMSELNGEMCTITTYELTLLKAKFAGWNVDGHDILVKDLETPALTTESALLRTTDLVAIQFDKQLEHL